MINFLMIALINIAKKNRCAIKKDFVSMEKKKPKKKKFKINIKNMGVDIDKNEYWEIVLSNSNHPENLQIK